MDHLDYYPSYKTSRERRYIQEREYLPKRQYEELNQAESKFLDTILTEIQKLKPKVHRELIDKGKEIQLDDLDNRLGYLYKYEKY